MFVSPAYAQAAGGAGGLGLGGLEGMLPLVLIFIVFYFLLIRPQQKKVKEHKALLDSIRRGDKVVTGGGILATVVKVVSDDELQVEIAEGVKVRVQRGSIGTVLARTEPAPGGTAANDDKGAAAPKSAGDKLKGLLGVKKD